MPLTARKDPIFQKRFGYFIGSEFATVVFVGVYVILGVGFLIIPLRYQWMLGLACPIFRQIFSWALFKLVSKAAGTDADLYKVEFLCNHYVESKHAIFMAIILGSVATDTTTYCIIGADFLINIYHGATIIQLYKRGNSGNKSNKGNICTIIPLIYLSLK